MSAHDEHPTAGVDPGEAAACGIDAGDDLALLRRELLELSAQPFEVLEALPESTQRAVATGGRPMPAVLWKDTLPDGRLRLVLQSAGGAFCCAGAVNAAGVVVSPDGSWIDAPEDLMDEFSMA